MVGVYGCGRYSHCPPSDNVIVLRHYRFESGTSGRCNNGRIVAHSINTTSDSDGIKYTSQLIIQLDENGTLEGRTVECAHDNGTHDIVIGAHVISYSIIGNYKLPCS